MKKILSFAVAALMVSGILGTALAAETITDLNNSTNIDVEAKYVDSSTVPDSYSVDIEWGSMQFTYSATGTKNWNADTHTYSIAGASGSWTAAGNTVTVTNHSNKEVSAAFSFAKLASVSDAVSGSFTYNKSAVSDSVTLAAGVENKPDEADSVIATLTLDGTLGSDKVDFTKVGTVTVALS